MVTLLAAATLLVAAPTPSVNARPGCPKTFSVTMVRRAIDATYHGTRTVALRDQKNLRRYVRCSRDSAKKQMLHRYWNRAWRAWWRRLHPPMNGPVVASWFDDAGGTACGIHATYGFATLLPIPCGAIVRMKGPSGVVVTATREDSGPYISGRTFDLNPALRDALGCGGLCEVYWH